jgi:hypothetical protein
MLYNIISYYFGGYGESNRWVEEMPNISSESERNRVKNFWLNTFRSNKVLTMAMLDRERGQVEHEKRYA